MGYQCCCTRGPYHLNYGLVILRQSRSCGQLLDWKKGKRIMFRFLTSGESHGPGLTAILEGIPAGLKLAAEDIDIHLQRRQGGYGRGGRMKIEQDRVIFRSGVRHGLTLGSPITLEIENRDWQNWQVKMSVTPVDEPVEAVTLGGPGHAELSGVVKDRDPDDPDVIRRSNTGE